MATTGDNNKFIAAATLTTL